MDVTLNDRCLDMIDDLHACHRLGKNEYSELHSAVSSLNDSWAEHSGKLADQITAMQAENKRLTSELDAYRQAEADGALVKRGTCTMTCQDEDSGHWACSCGSEWVYECGSPLDNEVKYCHKCGCKVTSVKERQYNHDTDEFEEVELMPQNSAALQEV